MIDLLSRLVGVLMLANGPQDMPSGSAPLVLAIMLYVATSAASLGLGGSAENPGAIVLLAVLLPLVLVRIVLSFKGHTARTTQTLTALFGSAALLSLLGLPLGLAGGGEQVPAVLVLASLVLFIWSFAVDAHIWRHALGTSFAVGLAVAVVLFIISMFIITSLAGPL